MARVFTRPARAFRNGKLHIFQVGDEAPDWVTNPALFAEHTDAPEPVEPVTDAPQVLADKSIKELRLIAENLGISKAGSKAELVGRIEAHVTPPVTDDTDLRIRAINDGVEGAEEMSDAELEAIYEG